MRETIIQTINDTYWMKVFQISNQNSREFLYIRLRITGPNWDNKNKLVINSFEIYGKLI